MPWRPMRGVMERLRKSFQAVEVVSLVDMELFRPLAGPAAPLPNRVDGIDHLGQSHAVVPVGSSQDDGER